ncbi:unnamed protein product [Rotaria sordida]|uniref:Cation/H+ exchanger transmembrane domain-containing protein n=1 Tax=Rotaria sordida TaxID=392033 RepID=A0A819DPU1_9BILA|nr:unnamed protein product [Rotaria sordida]CAF1076549.1 unnamed protein product [Rotaria sordida]CAF1112197.1 unnamed protein product [Rotaria sordida]CAF3682237.1 unnamed protein product [Rotaria sordida]CAF3711008.1 unnamed protein product [Rotaria sordida]
MVDIFADPSLDINYWPRFLMQVFIILVLVRLMGWLLALIKQPPVIGEIIAGIIVGPSVLGKIDFWSERIFPPSSWNYFTLVGNIGLILFMFNLGLELEQKQIKRQWKYSLPISIATIIIPYGAGAALSFYLYDINTRDGFQPPDRTAFVLFVASSMSFTAFPVLASILTSTKLLSAPIGTLTISCAALDDVMAWCSLAIAGAFAKESGIVGLWVVLISIGYVLFMFIIVRWIIKRIHTFLVERNMEMNRTFLIGIFLLLIASAFFCDILGIHSFFGAFVVGIICPKSGQFNVELFPKIELVTVELLLPLFFAASGMKTSLGSLNNKFYGGITVLIFTIAALGKFLPALFMTKIVTKHSWRFSSSVGILMNTRGLVELIALNIGLQLHILSPRLFTMFIIMALVTTFMTCPLLWLVYIRKYKPEEFHNETNDTEQVVSEDYDLHKVPTAPIFLRF